MSQDKKRIPFPVGLPNRLADPQDGFARLRRLLEIQNSKHLEALLDAEVVKHSVQHVSVAGLRGAHRRRKLLTAFYGMPDSRRELWRHALKPPHDASDTSMRRVPSLEFIALQSYDAEFREREIDVDAVEEALRDVPDAVESAADAPDWQRPAIAVMPSLHRDIAEWTDLPDDRREATLLAVFAVATVLDDLRLLQAAARGVATLADEFAMLLSDQPEDSRTGAEDPRTGEEDVIRQWRKSCDAVAAAARTLGADPLQPELLTERLSDLSRYVGILTALRDPVTQALNLAAPEKLLQRVDDILVALAEGDDSPIAGWTHQLAAQWRSAYSPAADTDVESLRADVERLEAALEHAVAAWRAECRHRAEVEKRHHEARRRAEQEDDPRKRLDAEDQEAELQQQLGRAAEAIQRARDHVFQIVAPADQVFDPRRDPPDPASPLPEPPDPSPAPLGAPQRLRPPSPGKRPEKILPIPSKRRRLLRNHRPTPQRPTTTTRLRAPSLR